MAPYAKRSDEGEISMKWLAFYGMAFLGVPVMIGLSYASPKVRRLLFALLILATCLKISVNFVSREEYRGPDRGYEVTMTDLVAVALGMSLLLRKPSQLHWCPPTTIPMALFFGAAFLSVMGCEVPLYGWFSLFKLVKAYGLYWVAYNTWILEPPEKEFLYGLIGIAGVETFYCLKQKYVHGLYRVYGTFDHSNTIPIYLIMFTPLILAWILHGKHLSRVKTMVCLTALAGCCVCILASQSRAGLLVVGAALAATMVRIVPHGLTGRKVALALVFALVATLGLAKAAPTIVHRFANAPKSSGQARAEFNKAAHAMAGDHFFGVGYNLFSHAMTHNDDYKSFAEVLGNEARAGVCHHIYNLTAAETGWIGLACFLLVVGSIHCRLMMNVWGAPTFNRSVVIAIFIGLSGVHLIGFLEWCFRLSSPTNMFLVMAAMGQAYCYHLTRESKNAALARIAKPNATALTPVLDPQPRTGDGMLPT